MKIPEDLFGEGLANRMPLLTQFFGKFSSALACPSEGRHGCALRQGLNRSVQSGIRRVSVSVKAFLPSPLSLIRRVFAFFF